MCQTIRDVTGYLTAGTTVMSKTVRFTASRTSSSVIMDQTGGPGDAVFLNNSYVTESGIVQVSY